MNALPTLQPVVAWLTKLIPSKKTAHVFEDCHIVTTRAGFQLVKEKVVLESVAWPGIQIIVAHKRDLITTDLVCFEIVLDDGSVIEVNEEMDGFEKFLTVLERTFASFDRNWPDKVLLPAFAPNRTMIYTGIKST
ncbi:MAG TPA: hypothetical protein VGK19_02820 [Capsulimonadaceae bacterium]|jgi:hypothetical protein